MIKHHRWWLLPSRQPAPLAFVACMAGLAWGGHASAAPTVEPRVLTQLGLGNALTENLLQNETLMIENFSTSPPACSKLPYGGSVKTLSVTEVSKTQYKSKIDIYFDAACKTPYIEAAATVVITDATETFLIEETASYLDMNGKALGQLAITDHFSVANNIETLRGLGKFTPVGGQTAADLGFTCSIPTTGNAKTLECQSGIAQTFKQLNLSIANVVPFTITAAANTNSPKVTFVGKTSQVRTGKPGSLSITAPTPTALAISGGGTAYTSTAISGSEAHYALFPPEPTAWTVTDTKNNARLAYNLVSNATRAAHASVATISPAKTLAAITLDRSGSGKVTYSDGSPAAVIRGYLAAD